MTDSPDFNLIKDKNKIIDADSFKGNNGSKIDWENCVFLSRSNSKEFCTQFGCLCSKEKCSPKFFSRK